jgi:hypothetical protein
MALALTAAVDRSRAAELCDELKKTCKSSSGPATPSAAGRSGRAKGRTRQHCLEVILCLAKQVATGRKFVQLQST